MDSEDDLILLPEQISAKYENLSNAPVVCDLKSINALGIIGIEENRFSIFKNIIIDICTRQYYLDVSLVFISTEEHKNRISWLRLLPYIDNPDISARNIVCDDESKNKIFDYLYKELSQREQGSKGKHIIIFFYDDYGFQNHPISRFVIKSKELNVTFVFMADSHNSIPQGCDYLVFADSISTGRLIKTDDNSDCTSFSFAPIDDIEAEYIINLIAPVYTEEVSLEGSLTKNISLFEMLNIIAVDDIDLTNRWASSSIFQSMAAPLGVTKSGTVFLDLHDKAHGPHGLVAGTTGSGKSEILQTYILSMATLFHPYEVGFVIIDFKGGGMVNQFTNLPHLLGSITNIDGKEIDRSLKSIKAELQKRQKLFAEAEVNHIDKYIKKFKSCAVKIPIPHLIIIVDEFAELKADQPEFMKELISAARIGRSLGVHLILATQKPSGQVDEQIWSNSRFKLCLKVQSQEDSNEVLKSPLAAEIKEPGRAYLQVGNNEIFELFQSAYSGAPEKNIDGNIKEFTISSVNDSGKRTPVFVQKKKKSDIENLSQLEALVKYVDEYCQKQNIQRLSSICLPPLPNVISLSNNISMINGLADIGLYDDPDNQYQGSAMLDISKKNTLIIGSSQYGKTNLLQLLIREIAQSSSPNESVIYIIDFGSMVLKNFDDLNHVGGVVTSSEDEKLKNLFKMLFNEVAIRKEKLVSVGVSSFTSYIEAGYKDIPHIYVLIDNLTALIELYLEDDDSLLNLVREGLSVGISFIVANAQTTGIGFKYLSNFANKIALHCNDSNEYSNLYDHISLKPDEKAGRCVFEIDKKIVEIQTYLAFEGEKEFERVLKMKEFIAEVNNCYSNQKASIIPCIPTVLSADLFTDNYSAKQMEYNVPIGLTYSDVLPYYLDLSTLGLIGLCGKDGTGHKNFIDMLYASLSKNSDKFPVEVVIFDDIKRKFNYLKDAPITSLYSLGTDKVESVLNNWYEILDRRYSEVIENGVLNKSSLLLMIK